MSIKAEIRVQNILEQIDQSNHAEHIYLSLNSDAMNAARASDRRYANNKSIGPLDGLIVSVKDNIDVAGLPTTAGIGFRKSIAHATCDAEVVSRLRQSGAIIIGKTNLHAAAFGATTCNIDFGNCSNPLHPGRVAGGSSGGAAASIAKGWADLAIGTDTMGSVRIPASYCGTSAIKPSFGRISTRGSVPLCRKLDHIGLLARDIRTLEAGLSVTAGFDILNPDSVDWPDSVDRISLPKVGAADSLSGVHIDSDVWSSFKDALSLIEKGGIHFQRFDLDGSQLTRLRRAGLVLCEAEMMLTYQQEWRNNPSFFPPDMLSAMRWIQGKSATDLASALNQVNEGVLIWRQWIADADVLLLPTTAHRAMKYDDPVPSHQADLTLLANFVGAPAVVIPIPAKQGASFCGIQLIGRPGSDFELLNFAKEIEQILLVQRN